MLIGYAVSQPQTTHLIFRKTPCRKQVASASLLDTASGAKAERVGLDEALSHLREGDTLVVWRLDRLGRSLKHLIETITALNKRGIGFQSITESIDTTTSGGELIFHIFGALAEFERDIIKERTQAGLTAARQEDEKGAGPRRLPQDAPTSYKPSTMIKTLPLMKSAGLLNIPRATLYQYIKTQ
jgi:DNA invertase Pin-like site-specific DNA recombinase